MNISFNSKTFEMIVPILNLTEQKITHPKYRLIRQYHDNVWKIQLKFILIHHGQKKSGETKPILLDNPCDLKPAIAQLKQLIIESVL